jgi:uncharacterized hydrophobic protein (TIGR00341 family)
VRIIEVVCDPGRLDTVRGIADGDDVLAAWNVTPADGARAVYRLLVAPVQVQPVLDRLQSAIGDAATSRLVVLGVEATVPRTAQPGSDGDDRKQQASREELYQDVEGGARLDGTYITLVLLSTIVADIGLIEDSVAVVIGAMVIAPLLGPNLAFALGAAIGDVPLVVRSLKTGAAGIAVALALSILVGLLWSGPLASDELLLRTDVGWDSIVLALAAGAAGVLSLTTGLPSVLVGVMVAVALLPPAATLGLMLGGSDVGGAIGAALLLAVNVVCVNLAAKLVFLVQGIRPRTWLAQRQAKQSMFAYLTFWVISLALLGAAVYLRQHLLETA